MTIQQKKIIEIDDLKQIIIQLLENENLVEFCHNNNLSYSSIIKFKNQYIFNQKNIRIIDKLITIYKLPYQLESIKVYYSKK